MSVTKAESQTKPCSRVSPSAKCGVCVANRMVQIFLPDKTCDKKQSAATTAEKAEKVFLSFYTAQEIGFACVVVTRIIGSTDIIPRPQIFDYFVISTFTR